MTHLKNALLLKQLYMYKYFGYRYTNLIAFNKEDTPLLLPQNIDQLKIQASQCHLCDISKSRTRVIFGEGDLHAKLLFITETPTTLEENQGKPFVGKSGEMFQNMLTNVLKISPNEVYVTPIVKCRPYNDRTPTPSEIYSCKPYLLQQIKLIAPSIIVTLGPISYRYLTGDETPLSQIRGNVMQYENYTLIPTYHPTYLLKNPYTKKEVLEDLKRIEYLMKLIQ